MNLRPITGLFLLAAGFMSGSAWAQSDASSAVAPAPVTANLSIVSDYRFRGLSQSYRLPAVQGGFDYTHPSGFYLGNWDSSVSGNSYNNGASLEVDLYGGYRFEPVKDLTLDLGVLTYVYPGATLNAAPGQPSDHRYDNTELYAGATYAGFGAKVSYAATDYFGLNGATGGYAYWSALPDNGGSRGTVYVDLNYSVDLGDKLTLAAHVGRTEVRHYGELSYTDAKLALTKEWAGFTFGASVVGSDADKRYYQVGNAAAQSPKEIGATTVVVSVARTF
jgi:uncharacterized protein (TIGR02001 family)